MTRQTRGMATARRGGAYLAVLSIAALVTVIGLAGLWSARTTQRTTALDTDTTRARQLAEAAVELALITINRDPSWRTTYRSGDWSTPQACDGATLSFSLVDETDGDLADDDTQAFRVYGRADAGDAVRIVSAQAEPFDPADANLLTNGDGEAGTTGWSVYQGTGVLTWNDSKVHGGTGSLRLHNRSADNVGIAQDLTGQVDAGRAYDITVWVRPRNVNATAVVGFAVTTTLGAEIQFARAQAVTKDTWNELTVQVTPTWVSDPTAVRFYVGVTGSTNRFWADDMTVTEAAVIAPVAHRVVPGTWRREVQ